MEYQRSLGGIILIILELHSSKFTKFLVLLRWLASWLRLPKRRHRSEITKVVHRRVAGRREIFQGFGFVLLSTTNNGEK
ncbi:hypothetical protein EJ110_NYTH56778 [Nymphaea thermarum]|nr:hypothetical protein EJ110_NYTH56778 [Nymphaea thermarum]